MDNTIRSVAVWGDSLAKGVIWNPQRQRHTALDITAASVAADRLGVRLENRARFGFTAPRGSELLENDLESGVVTDAALLEFGGNDCNFDWAAISENPDAVHEPATKPDVFYRTLCGMVKRLYDARVKPILLTLPPIDAERYFRFLVGDRLNGNNILKWLGDKQQIYRFQELYSNLVQRVAARTQCMLLDVRSRCLANHRMPELLCEDGLHLTREGQVFVGETIAEIIEQGE